jgi:hypothetical protein
LINPGGGPRATLLDQPAADEFSLVYLPDTQVYSAEFPALFQAQTQWIADNRARFNIQAVLHVGDIVDDNAPEQWANADTAIRILDAAEIPYLLAIGNHDYDTIGDAGRLATGFNGAFPPDRYARHAWWRGGFYEPGHSENAYCRLAAAGQDYLLLSLEFGPRQAVIDWAHDILTAHAGYRAIVITHSYLYLDGTRVKDGDAHNPKIYPLGPTAHDGEDLWVKLVSRHDNIRWVHSGHHIGGQTTAYRGDSRPGGAAVHQMYANWQLAANGGNGWMQLVTFAPRQARVQTFSPTLDVAQTDASGKFSVPL